MIIHSEISVIIDDKNSKKLQVVYYSYLSDWAGFIRAALSIR